MRTETRRWTVMTWNIQGQKGTDINRLADVISAVGADVVALQEVRRPQAAALAQRLSMSHRWVRKHNPFRPFLPSRAEGAAILTPHSLTDTGMAIVSDEHSKRSYKRRVAVWGTVSRDDHSSYRVINAHLSPHGESSARLTEARRIAEIAASAPSAPVVVAGDFNDHDEPAVIETLPGEQPEQSPPTNPSEAPWQRLDHVLVPADARVVEVQAPEGSDAWAELSDHVPLTVRFDLDWVSGDWT
ncbi:MAG: endonuclease/exonuclease/phosphatase family protein [Ilumatobacter sp.]